MANNATAQKDNRKTFNYHPIRLEGNVVYFDGKLDPDKKELKIYRMFGDVRLYDDAIQDFCIENGILSCKARI